MPTRPAVKLTPEPSDAVLAGTVRRVDAAMPGAVDVSDLRRVPETETAERPNSLAKLMKTGRRRMLDLVARIHQKAQARC